MALWVDEQGPSDGDPVLLLAGADSPGFRWTGAVVDPLVAAGHRVIRYDHRDCGRSSRIAPSDPYLLIDLAGDVVALLAALGIERVHLVGRSMGGTVAQVLALDHPRVVRSLTLLSSTPGAGDERLPGPDDSFVEAMTRRLFAGPPADDAGRIDWITDLHRLLAGPLHPFDERGQRALAAAEIGTGWVAETGHGVAVHASPSRLDRLAEIEAPTLVVHGDADPVYPIEHGRALGLGIDGAVLVEVEGLGHEIPDPFLAVVAPVIVRHLAGATAWFADHQE